MSEYQFNELAEQFLKEIRHEFPHVIMMDKLNDSYLYEEIEVLADLTTYAFDLGNTDEALTYLYYIEKKLKTANDVEQLIIEDFYIDNLFYKGTQAGIDKGFSLVPMSLLEIYLKKKAYQKPRSLRDPIMENFLNEIRKKFPDVIPLMDQGEHDFFAYTFKMEEFANLTTYAFNDGDTNVALQHLHYIEKKLKTADATESGYIDVCYVEHLFWKGTQAGIDIGWPLVPKSLKELYLNFHRSKPKVYVPSKK